MLRLRQYSQLNDRETNNGMLFSLQENILRSQFEINIIFINSPIRQICVFIHGHTDYTEVGTLLQKKIEK